MLRKLRPRLTYANVVSTLCLFLVVGGGSAYATHLVVNSSDIVDGQVKEPDLAGGAVTRAKLRDGAVQRGKIDASAVTSTKVQDNDLTGADILDNSLDGDDIGIDGVGTSEIADLSVFGIDLGNNAVDSTKVEDDSLTGNDIDESSLGKVPDADTLDGKNSSDFLGPSEAHQTPTLETCDGGSNTWAPVPGLEPHYWRDGAAIVHLEGAVTCPGNTTGASIFQMPNSYKPRTQDVVRYGMLGAGLSMAQVAVVQNAFTAGVLYDGGTSATTDNYVSLDGITYQGLFPP